MSDVREQRKIVGERLENLDKASRREWSISCTVMLLSVAGREGILAMQARGFHEFLRVAKAQWEGHAFKFDDYQRSWRIINIAAERLKAGKGLGKPEDWLPQQNEKRQHFMGRR